MNIQWELHKDGNYYAYQDGHTLVAKVSRSCVDTRIFQAEYSNTIRPFLSLVDAKQWVVDQANGVL